MKKNVQNYWVNGALLGVLVAIISFIVWGNCLKLNAPGYCAGEPGPLFVIFFSPIIGQISCVVVGVILGGIYGKLKNRSKNLS